MEVSQRLFFSVRMLFVCVFHFFTSASIGMDVIFCFFGCKSLSGLHGSNLTNSSVDFVKLGARMSSMGV